MFSGLIPGLNSATTPDDELSGHIPAILMSLLDLPHQLPSIEPYVATNSTLFSHSVAFFRRQLAEFGVQLVWRTLFICVYFGIFVSIALIALSRYSEEEEKKHGCDFVGVVAEDSPGTEWEAAVLGSMYLFRDEVLTANGAEIFPESDERPLFKGEPSRVLCGICFEEKQITEMFTTETCSHSFCHDCTSKHIAAKIQDNIIVIPCPGIDCKSALNPEFCRQIVPKDVLIRWDECLCKSLIPESQRVHCPFRDCSVTLVNDSGETIGEIRCPSCKRSICARCGVPWHSEFTCAEFERLSGREEDVWLVEELAKKKRWRKCPNCNFYVEKTEGCLHITCRCGHEFCYRCGGKWAKSHVACRLGPESRPTQSQFPPTRSDWDCFLLPSSIGLDLAPMTGSASVAMWGPPPPPLPLPLFPSSPTRPSDLCLGSPPPPSPQPDWDYFFPPSPTQPSSLHRVPPPPSATRTDWVFSPAGSLDLLTFNLNDDDNGGVDEMTMHILPPHLRPQGPPVHLPLPPPPLPPF